MNVLVYAGPEALKNSVTHSISSLRSLLLPHYSVQTITNQTINSQPWKASCALFVIPQCNGTLQTASSAAIEEFVESGGSLLIFGAGAIRSSRELTGAASISQDLLLGVFDRTTRLYTYLTYFNDGDLSNEPLALHTSDGSIIEGISGLRSDKLHGLGDENTILARTSNGSIAGLSMRVGRGKMAVWTSSIEVPLTKDATSSPASPNVSAALPVAESEKSRLELLKATLLSLELRFPSVDEHSISRPLPQFLVSTPDKNFIVLRIAADLGAAVSGPGSQSSEFKDNNDTFLFHNVDDTSTMFKEEREKASSGSAVDPSQWQPKHIILCPNSLPERATTPLFDLRNFFDALSAGRRAQGCREETDSWGIGEALFYGEAVTSTQTMLDKNPQFLSRLPTPLVSLASFQLAGRGRGANVWLSPAGCLQFSVLLRLSLATFPAGKLVFIQYLFALAVVEACRDANVLGSKGQQIRLKWPNDIYAIVDGERKKIGGVLVNTSFSGGKIDVIIGCGLNVLNVAPIFSLAQLLPPNERPNLTLENTLSNILTRFEKMWDIFLQERGSFDSFMNLYLERWLHSDQLVTLTTVTPPQQVRITGITADYGLLRTLPERTGWSGGSDSEFIDLQPDGNSFDIMAGLIKSKS